MSQLNSSLTPNQINQINQITPTNFNINDMEEIIHCSICLEQYNDTTKVPRVLKCGHSFCHECLEKMVYKITNIGELYCPLDKTIGNNSLNISDLPLNRLILDLLQFNFTLNFENLNLNDNSNKMKKQINSLELLITEKVDNLVEIRNKYSNINFVVNNAMNYVFTNKNKDLKEINSYFDNVINIIKSKKESFILEYESICCNNSNQLNLIKNLIEMKLMSINSSLNKLDFIGKNKYDCSKYPLESQISMVKETNAEGLVKEGEFLIKELSELLISNSNSISNDNVCDNESIGSFTLLKNTNNNNFTSNSNANINSNSYFANSKINKDDNAPINYFELYPKIIISKDLDFYADKLINSIKLDYDDKITSKFVNFNNVLNGVDIKNINNNPFVITNSFINNYENNSNSINGNNKNYNKINKQVSIKNELNSINNLVDNMNIFNEEQIIWCESNTNNIYYKKLNEGKNCYNWNQYKAVLMNNSNNNINNNSNKHEILVFPEMFRVAHLNKNKFILTGGSILNKSINSSLLIEHNNVYILGSMFFNRKAHSMIKLNSYEVIVCGGIDENDNYLSSCEKISIQQIINNSNSGNTSNTPPIHYASNNKRISDMKIQKSHSTLCLYNNKLLFSFGGQNSQGFLDDIEAYSFKDDIWIIVSIKLPIKLECCSSVNYGNKIFILGGFSTNGLLSDVYCYTPDIQENQFIDSSSNYFKNRYVDFYSCSSNCHITKVNKNLNHPGWSVYNTILNSNENKNDNNKNVNVLIGGENSYPPIEIIYELE